MEVAEDNQLYSEMSSDENDIDDKIAAELEFMSFADSLVKKSSRRRYDKTSTKRNNAKLLYEASLDGTCTQFCAQSFLDEIQNRTRLKKKNK